MSKDSQGEIVEVQPLFVEEAATPVWISERAADALRDLDKSVRMRFLRKLERYAASGFENFTSRSGPIRHEWDGVYRIGNGGLFRLIGFFAGDDDFIIIDGFTKKGQQLGVRERERIDRVAEVKRRGLWRKNEATS